MQSIGLIQHLKYDSGSIGLKLPARKVIANAETTSCIVSILSCCLLPMVLLSSCSVIMSLQGMLGAVLTVVRVLWFSISASKFFMLALKMDRQQLLVSYMYTLVFDRVSSKKLFLKDHLLNFKKCLLQLVVQWFLITITEHKMPKWCSPLRDARPERVDG